VVTLSNNGMFSNCMPIRIIIVTTTTSKKCYFVLLPENLKFIGVWTRDTNKQQFSYFILFLALLNATLSTASITYRRRKVKCLFMTDESGGM